LIINEVSLRGQSYKQDRPEIAARKATRPEAMEMGGTLVLDRRIHDHYLRDSLSD
jgi:hypothetical protein